MKLISTLNKLLSLCLAPFRDPFRATCERTRTGSNSGYLCAQISSGFCEVRSRTSSSGCSEIGTKVSTSLNLQYLTQSFKYPPPVSSPPTGPAPTYLPLSKLQTVLRQIIQRQVAPRQTAQHPTSRPKESSRKGILQLPSSHLPFLSVAHPPKISRKMMALPSTLVDPVHLEVVR